MNKIGFIHSYQVNNWQDILDRQIGKIISSGLYDNIDKIFIGFNGNKNIGDYIKSLNIKKKFEILYQIDYPQIYEALTLSFLYRISQNFDGYVFYIHSKGVSRNSPQCQTDWRNLMEYWIINRWEDCIKELLYHDMVGINWHFGEGYMGASSRHAEGTPVTPHFSGNFWWANSTYIRKLNGLYPLRSKYECEFWHGLNKPKVAELWHSGIHHHRNIYPPELYTGEEIQLKSYQ